MSNISGALREDMDDCILPLDPAPKEMKSNNNIFINIFLVIGPGSEIAYDKKYEHCTFVFCAIEREQMSKIINRLDAISCLNMPKPGLLSLNLGAFMENAP